MSNGLFSPSGRKVTWQQCAAPDNSSEIAAQLPYSVDWNSSQVKYGECEITVSEDNFTDDSHQYSCPYGYDYDYRKELSFRTEVCLWEKALVYGFLE